MKQFYKITSPGVQGKFLLGLAGILFFFCLLWAATMYSYQRNRLQEEAFRRTELVMEAVSASRAYIREILRPRMYDLLGRDVFIIEAMSTSYATRVIMEKFREGMPNITYRRVAINARNPGFEADQQEQEMIQYFNENPEIESWQGIRVVGDERYYVRCSPVHYETSCLHCHGKPEDAPGSVLELYGETKGFHRKTDHIASVVSVGIRVEEGLRRIGQFAITLFTAVFMSFFILYAIIAFSFNRLIVQNIRALLGTFRLNLTDPKGEHLYEQARNMDEIGELHATATLLARHLQENHLQLEDYAENLERKVEERTKELQQSREQLHQQMLSQGRELNTLNVIAELITQSVDLLSILPKVLRQTLEVIPAQGAGIYLFRADCQGLFLQCRDNAPELADQLFYDRASQQIRVADVATHPSVPSPAGEGGCDELNFFTSGLAGKKLVNIPLCCHKRLLGLMTLTGYEADEIDPKHRELLLSIGRQVGITMESLQNMASLLQGKELLQSVFDAIADLVVLISPDGVLHMVNRAFLTGYQFRPEMIVGRRIEDLAREYPVPFLLFSQISLIKLQEPVSDCKRLDNGQFF